MNAWTTARWAGMGGTGIAAANDAAAIDFNPANLPHMELDGVDMGRPLAWGGTATYGSGTFDDLSLKIGTVSNQGNHNSLVFCLNYHILRVEKSHVGKCLP